MWYFFEANSIVSYQKRIKCIIKRYNLSQEQNNVSQIRHNIFYGEEENVKIKVFSEEKEYPFINDGIANNRENFVIVKVLNEYNDTTITLSYNGQNYNDINKGICKKIMHFHYPRP